MSYNIDHVELLPGSTLTITAKDLRMIGVSNRLPDNCFVWDMLLKVDEGTCECGRKLALEDNFCAKCARPNGALADVLPVQSLTWNGEWSGSTYKALLEKVLPLTKGKGAAVLAWERGDSFSGISVEDGVVTEMDVVFTLVPRKEGGK